MSDAPTFARASARPVRLLDADHLILRLTGLTRQQEERGRISHALGVRSATELVQRDLGNVRRAAKLSDER